MAAGPHSPVPTARVLRAGSAILILLALAVLAGCAAVEQLVAGPTITPSPPGGTMVDPPIDLPDFTLTSQTGDPLSLSDLRGRPALFYFGYTHCPDVCPLTLAEFKQIATALGDQASQVAFVFVSVDIRRDTPARLREYLGAFSPDFIGLTTDDERQLQQVTAAFGVLYELEEVAGTQADYLVAHTSSSFLVNDAGQLTTIYAYQTPPDIITSDLRAMLDDQN